MITWTYTKITCKPIRKLIRRGPVTYNKHTPIRIKTKQKGMKVIIISFTIIILPTTINNRETSGSYEINKYYKYERSEDD